MNVLGKMIGPFPLGVWLAVMAGGLGIAYVLQRSEGEAADDAEADNAAAPGVAGVPYLPYGAGIISFDNSRDDDTEEITDNNMLWIRRMVLRLAELGGYPELAVQTALTKYVDGVPLTAAECEIVSAALSLQLPPDPVPAADCPEVPSRPVPPPQEGPKWPVDEPKPPMPPGPIGLKPGSGDIGIFGPMGPRVTVPVLDSLPVEGGSLPTPPALDNSGIIGDPVPVPQEPVLPPGKVPSTLPTRPRGSYPSAAPVAPETDASTATQATGTRPVPPPSVGSPAAPVAPPEVPSGRLTGANV